MPIQITIDNDHKWIFPKAQWQSLPIKGETIYVDPDFYIETKEM